MESSKCHMVVFNDLVLQMVLLHHVLTRRKTALGLRYRDIADNTGFSKSHINDVINGKKLPGDDLLMNLADVVGIPFSELKIMKELTKIHNKIKPNVKKEKPETLIYAKKKTRNFDITKK